MLKHVADPDDIPTNKVTVAAFNTVLERRSFLKLGVLSTAVGVSACSQKAINLASQPLEDIRPAQVVIVWGDALFSGLDAFDPVTLTADGQQKRFGYNADFTAYFPIVADRGLLCVNHEFTQSPKTPPSQRRAKNLMHPPEKDRRVTTSVELAAVGLSVVEVVLKNGQWRPVLDSRYNRRLSCYQSNYKISGPASDSNRVGKTATGMLGNCAGGVTPWGTLLTCEENFDFFFKGQGDKSEARNNKRYGVGRKDALDWGDYDDRFDLSKSPLEANKYGWVVEVDPFKQDSTPVKRTALGRFKHEAACCVETDDGRVVVYSGDDQHFEYFYRYVSNGPWRESLKGNVSPLDDGVLYVAKFLESGAIEWLPLIYGQNGLTPENGFDSQGDVLIEARIAASILGATPMDRPEGITLNPKNNEVYFCCTKNKRRKKANAANPRVNNKFGHIITINSKDHGTDTGSWEIFTLGDDRRINTGAVPCPDNIMAVPNGDLYVTTDGAESAINIPEGLYKINADRTATKLYHGPKGSEITGPSFTPDSKHCFFSIQHPAAGSTYDNPDNRWPSEKDSKLPPRPGVVVMKI